MKTKKPKPPARYVQNPTLSNGEWVVRICEGRSPLAPVVEEIKCGTSRERAWQTYRLIQKERGKML